MPNRVSRYNKYSALLIKIILFSSLSLFHPGTKPEQAAPCEQLRF